MKNFYKELGNKYFKNNDVSEVNNLIYNDAVINIEIRNSQNIGESESIEEIKYSIERIYCEDFSNILNNKVKENLEKINKNNSLFEVYQQIIVELKNYGCSYFRGQSSDWETRPGLFRNLTNSDSLFYFETFEDEYKEISKEFPTEIRYVELTKENIETRANELAKLQHYGLPTSMLDVTNNPYIAMLFMLYVERIDNPQLEFYSFDNSDETNLLSTVQKSETNRRLIAQKGAFINYDKLIFYQSSESEMKITSKINRVIVKLSDVTSYIDTRTDSVINFIDEKIVEINQSIDQKGHESIMDRGFIESLQLIKEEFPDLQKNKSGHQILFEKIKNELLEKLAEFYYTTDMLYPDLPDQLRIIREKYRNK